MSRHQLSSGWLSQILKTGYSRGGIYVTDQVISMVLGAAICVLSPALAPVGISSSLLVTTTKSIRPSDARLIWSLLRGRPSWKDLLLSILARRARLAGIGSRMSRIVQQQQAPLADISTSKTACAGAIAAGLVVLAGTYMIRGGPQRAQGFMLIDPQYARALLRTWLHGSRYAAALLEELARLREENAEVSESNDQLQRDMQQAAQREAQLQQQVQVTLPRLQQQLQDALRLLQVARTDIAELEGEAERHAMFRPFWLHLALLPNIEWPLVPAHVNVNLDDDYDCLVCRGKIRAAPEPLLDGARPIPASLRNLVWTRAQGCNYNQCFHVACISVSRL